MPLDSALYLLFLFTGALVYWLLAPGWRASFLLLLSGAFFLYAGPLHLLVVLLLTLHTWIIGRELLRRPSRWVLAYGIAVPVLALVLWKLPVQSTLGLVLPIGLSYYVFECIHMLVDIHRGAIHSIPLFDMLSCTLFFPTRSGGPIKRFPRFAEQLHRLVWEQKFLLWGGAFLLLGFVQKVIIADPLMPFLDDLQALRDMPSSLTVLRNLYLYSLLLYANFAGLSNIAIGSSLLFGIVVPKNFAYPYLQPNIALFWRRWHMSLSDWVRDYLYIPLGGNRVGRARMVFNLMLPMLIIGAWHGLTWNFLAWGLYHGCGLALHRLWTTVVRVPQTRIFRILGILCTFHFVTLGWVFFLTDSLADSVSLLRLLLPI